MQILRDTGIAMAPESAAVLTGVREIGSVPAAQADRAVTSPTESVEQSINNVQRQLSLMKETNVHMEYDKDIHRVLVKYTNATGEVVRQIPTEKFVEFEKAFVKTLGLLFDLKV